MHRPDTKAHHKGLAYRPEIDGLRAFAVLPVILYHARVGLFPGGYVGVDVFFVISGYLITSLIIAEKEAGNFSLAKFYERRARRILPALFLVILVTLPWAWLWMAPSQLRDFAKSVVAVPFFAANFFFWRDSGYFAADVQEKPLLHTWSLGIEEQYYVLFPLVMLAFWPLGKRWLWVLTFFAAIGSLAVAEIGWRRWPDANFYLLHARLWELAVGGLIAFYLRNPLTSGRVVHEVMSSLGLALIIASAVLYDETTPFPSLYTIVPVAGTALVILFATPTTLAGRLLSFPVFVGLGLISYSAYLWHQPLFAFYRIVSFNTPRPWEMLVLVAISIGLAYLSWRYVENWFRRKASTRTLVMSAVGCALLLIGIGSVFSYFDLSRPLTPEQLAKIEHPNGNYDAARTQNCHAVADSDFQFVTCSRHPSLPRKAILYGDSHAVVLYLALSDELAAHDIDLMTLSYGREDESNCPKFLGNFRVGSPPSFEERNRCTEHTRAMARTANNLGAEYFFIAFRWTFALYPATGEITSLDFDNGEGGVGAESYRANQEHFVFDARGDPSTSPEEKYAATVAALLPLAESFRGKLVLIGPVPEVGWSVTNRNRKSVRLSGEVEQTISTSYDRFIQRNRLANRIIAEVGRQAKNVIVISPQDVFCDTFLYQRCVAQLNYEPLYSDDNHLNTAGEKLLIRLIVERIDLPPATNRMQSKLP